jgi:hypothetical protein
MATELQIRQDEAIALGDVGTAYRLGLLEACRIISETGGRYLGVAVGDPFLATNECWREVFDAAGYLREVADS